VIVDVLRAQYTQHLQQQPERPVSGALAFSCAARGSRVCRKCARAVQHLLNSHQTGASLRQSLNHNTMEDS
jgi:hypothetical protein